MNFESLAPDAILPEHEGTSETMYIFMAVKATRHWLDLANEQRLAFFRDTLYPILKRRPQVTLRYFETEAFSALASDLLVWQTCDLNAWAWIADHLRETLFWDHYFEVISIMPAIEANYLAMMEAV